ncbi:MAG: apolipoprotein N-acyltransferase [Gammaproteobacteria bacterium]
MGITTPEARPGRLVLAFLAGCSFPLAFAPVAIYPFAILALAVLWLLWEGATPATAARIGFIWGAGAFLAGTYWLYISIHIFGEAPVAVAVLLMLGLVAIMALYLAFVGWFTSRIRASGGARWLLILPGSWVLVEWFRGWFLSGFPWLSLGYSQTDNWLAGYAPVAGVYGASLAVAVLAGCVVAAVHGRITHRVLALAVATIIALGGAWAKENVRTPETDREISVALIQGAVPQEEKWLPEKLEPTKELYLSETRKHWDADLVVWPEAAIPAIAYEEEEFLLALEKEARDNESEVVLGMLERNDVTGHYYNSVFTLGGDQGVYRKRHLVPFGEYFPVPDFVRQWMRLMSLPYVDISRGQDVPAPLRLAGESVGMTICYEDSYGAEQLVFLPEAGFLVNVSNDAWFGDSIAPHQHLQIARMRALEAGRYLLRATNTGISAIIGPDGGVLTQSPQFETDVLTGRIRVHRGATPYAQIGNSLAVGLAALMVILGFAIGRLRAT